MIGPLLSGKRTESGLSACSIFFCLLVWWFTDFLVCILNKKINKPPNQQTITDLLALRSQTTRRNAGYYPMGFFDW